MNRIALLLVLTVSSPWALADSSKAAIKADFDNLCNVIARSGAAKHQVKSEQVNVITTWLREHLKTPEVNKFLKEVSGSRDAGAKLKKAAADAGYTGACPLADAT
ncbi:MAG TPA: hypothetical protein VGF94_26290 [Kofleriaceae bacterium]